MTLASAGLIATGSQLLTVSPAQAVAPRPSVRPALQTGAATAPTVSPTLAPLPASSPNPLVYATTAVRVRSAASTSSAILGVLPKGGHVGSRGASVNGWTPVNYQGTKAWISTAYLTTSAPSQGSSGSSSSSSASKGQSLYATTAVRVRSAASTSSTIRGVLAKGQSVVSRGASVNGWTPVTYQGTNAWISTAYLTTSAPSQGSSGAGGTSSASKGQSLYATTAVRVRSAASTSSTIRGVLAKGQSVVSRGASVNGWTPVTYQGTNAWISTAYLTTSAPSQGSSEAGGTSSGSQSGTSSASAWATLLANGSSGLSGLRPSAKGIVDRTISQFPQIKTIYGVRADAYPDHPSGHAIDLMMPRGASDNALGWTVANYYKAHALELGVQYIMWDKKIWNISRDSEGWRDVADRGGVTANHQDHVHITTIWD
ncbi:SH3 domain-containing protein [Acidipropionibacterium jensenii]|uniref:SH3 domain-containing protein n=1 Tax=Acidipropionibacterium jensenii TaxID=1749 RepID=UPI00214A98E5